MSEMTTTALANWYGSNRMLAFHVGAELSGCDWVGIPFAGGMCEVRHIAARQILVNDLHRHLINLARVVKDPASRVRLYAQLKRLVFHPDELHAAQERCMQREELFDQPDELFARTGADPRFDPADRVAWAVDYFVATWMSRGGKGGTVAEFDGGLPIRWNAGGGASVVRFNSAVRSMVAWGREFRRCEFSTEDAFDFLASVKDEFKGGVYCDPPFPGPGDRYAHQLKAKGSLSGQGRLAKAVSRFQATRVVMRFYDHPLIRELYPSGNQPGQWKWLWLTGRKQSNELAAEVLLLNGPSRANEVAGA